MSFTFRAINKKNSNEMRFVAEMDSRIPLDYDSTHTFAESSIDQRLEFYNKLTDADFFELIEHENSIVGFHIVMKSPYPPAFQIGNIITLWVHPHFRGKGLAAELKERAETWAKKSGLIFMQTNVHKNNERMLKMNEQNGYETAYLSMRKKLV